MMVQPAANYPITDICIVADPQKCPPSYIMLMKSKDKETDCDLWRENNMFKRMTRYLCFTRHYIPDKQDNKVLIGLQILNDRDFPPSGFLPIEKTIDSSEKACRKRQICFKMADRNTTKFDAISDILILSKTKRPPEGYTLLGDVHGLILCYKLDKIPYQSQVFTHSTSATALNGLRPAPPPPLVGSYKSPNPLSQANNKESSGVFSMGSKPLPLPRNFKPVATNALSHVDFTINPTLTANQSLEKNLFPAISFRSINDIENEFSYQFSLEKSFLQRWSKENGSQLS